MHKLTALQVVKMAWHKALDDWNKEDDFRKKLSKDRQSTLISESRLNKYNDWMKELHNNILVLEEEERNGFRMIEFVDCCAGESLIVYTDSAKTDIEEVIEKYKSCEALDIFEELSKYYFVNILTTKESNCYYEEMKAHMLIDETYYID